MDSQQEQWSSRDCTCLWGLQMTGLLSFTMPCLRPVSIKDSKQMIPCKQHTFVDKMFHLKCCTKYSS